MNLSILTFMPAPSGAMGGVARGARPFDLVVFGSTGFAGRQAVKHLARRYPNGEADGLKWAIAGRDQAKLEALAASTTAEFGAAAPQLLVHANLDTAQAADLEPIAGSTRAIANFAGPFRRYGSAVVAAAVRMGTDYCDITGETAWVRQMVRAHDAAARKTGARIVHLCGQDSVPWDLLTHMLHKRLPDNEALGAVRFREDIRGAISGGSVETIYDASAQRPAEDAAAAGSDAIGLSDPLLTSDDGRVSESILQDVSIERHLWPHREANVTYGEEAVVGYFLMTSVNADAVRRSNALLGYSGVGPLEYDEAIRYASKTEAFAATAGLLALAASFKLPPLRWLIRGKFLPAVGQGPSEEQMDSHYLVLEAHGTGTFGSKVAARLRIDDDCGYRDTARTCCEAAAALALNDEGVRQEGGVLTPGACHGEALLRRMQRAGPTHFEYLD